MSQDALVASRYRLEESIGSGGMGTVYRAEDTFTGEIVAIKHLHPELVRNSPDMIRRFKREGRLLRDLNHPNIVKLLDAVQEGIEDHYLIMEYVSGGSLLDALSASGELPVKRALSIGLDVADALTRAHRLNIIHRDLKPANILIAEDGATRLTDFGIARHTGTDTITDPHEMLGTVAYMSPEAIIGDDLDPRTDIWSFGVVLFEMLTGVRPFGAGVQVIPMILNAPVPDPASLRPDLSETLVDLLYRMLEKNRQARIPSMRTVGAEIEAALQGREPGFGGGGDGRAHAESAFREEVTALGSRASLPVMSTPFVGREADLAAIQKLVEDCRLVTLAGPGGMGKTRLAIETADRLTGRYSDGVYFVPLAPVADSDDVIPTIASALGVSLTAGRSAQDQLIGALRGKQALLAVDNLEHVLGSSEAIASLLDGAPKIRLLMTSRERLRLSAECVFEVGGMAAPQTHDDAVFEDFEAVELFVMYARRAQPGFTLEKTDRPAVMRICQALQGMPLGLELAAAWTRALSPTEIADELEADVDFLTSSQADVDERHRSIRAVFDYSWNLLTEDEQQALASLSVFRGGATREAARAVTGARLATLVSLADKSLVWRDPASGRFHAHELVRQFAEEALTESDNYDETRTAHSRFFAQHLADHERSLTGHAQGEALRVLTADIDNIRAAWDWAVAQGLFDILSLAAHPFFAFYWLKDWAQEGVQTFERAVAAAEVNPDATPLILGRLLTYTGALYKHAWYINEASEPLGRGIELLREAGDRHALAHATAQLAHLMTWQAQDDISEVLPVAEEALRLFEGIDDPQWETFAYHVAGTVYNLMGRHEEAKVLHERNLTLRREAGDRAGVGYTLNTLAVFERVGLENYEQSRTYSEESLAVFREIDNKQGIIFSYNNLAAVLGFTGQFDEAIAVMEEVMEISRDTTMVANMSGSLANTGFAYWMKGDLDRAEELGREALEIAQHERLVGESYAAYDLLCRTLQEKGALDEARKLGERALPLAGYNFASPSRVLFSLGVIAAEQGRLDEARQHFHDALHRGQQEQLPYLMYGSLYRCAWLLRAEDKTARAVEILSYLLSVPALPAFTRWRAEAKAEELRPALAAEDFEAAWARGQTFELASLTGEVMEKDLSS